MKTFVRLTPIILLIAALSTLSSCNAGDDVIEIFTGRVWKLSYISLENNYTTPFDFWNGDAEAMEASMRLKDIAQNFTIEFTGGLTNSGSYGGSFTGRAVNSTVVGYWSADGDTKELTFKDVKWSGTESDAYAWAFVRGISNNVFAYSGDSENLYIHYKEELTTKVMAFRHPLK